VAEGITIHKSQGQSMNEVVVKMSYPMERSLIYVALSRATSLNGLYLIGDFKPPNTPQSNHPPLVEMERMRNESLLVPKFVSLRELPVNTFQIISHNVQSLRKHLQCITNDKVYMESNLLLFQETWTTSNEHFDIPNYHEILKNTLNGAPKAFGTVIYAKNNKLLEVNEGSTIAVEEGKKHIEITTCKWRNIQIINIYVNPSSTINYLISMLNNYDDIFKFDNVLIIGDFNERRLETECKPLEDYFKNHHNMLLLSPRKATTNELTTLDAIFGKLTSYEIEVFIYESVFSFHKPLVIRLKNK